jgi:hypothetical protein
LCIFGFWRWWVHCFLRCLISVLSALFSQLALCGSLSAKWNRSYSKGCKRNISTCLEFVLKTIRLLICCQQEMTLSDFHSISILKWTASLGCESVCWATAHNWMLLTYFFFICAFATFLLQINNAMRLDYIDGKDNDWVISSIRSHDVDFPRSNFPDSFWLRSSWKYTRLPWF